MKALRTVSETADIRVIEGLAIPFGGPYPGNSDDYGTRATAKTNFYWSLFPDRAPTDAPEVPARFTRPVTYGHGFDDAIGLVRIGGWSPIRQDKQGVWVQAQLDKRQAWYASIGELLDRDALSFSSASVEHAARIARNGDWVDWPVFELALTPTPSNPKAEVTVRSGKMRCAACDVSMATDVQGMLAQLMGTEEGEADQITLLKGNTGKDVGRRHRGKQQVPRRHYRCGPEEDDKTEINRVTHQVVQERRPEPHRRHRLADEIVGDLMQAEQFEVIDQERADKNKDPTEQTDAQKRGGELRVIHLPHHCRERPPLPEQEKKREASEQHVGAALNRFRYVLCPPLLELLARHHAVLRGEQRHQKKVNCDRLCCRRFQTGVDGLWYDKAGNEADGIEDCGEKREIGDKPIEERNEFHEAAFRDARANGLELGHDRLRQE
jgi:hypothetical protein